MEKENHFCLTNAINVRSKQGGPIPLEQDQGGTTYFQNIDFATHPNKEATHTIEESPNNALPKDEGATKHASERFCSR